MGRIFIFLTICLMLMSMDGEGQVMKRFKIPLIITDRGAGRDTLWFGHHPNGTYCREVTCITVGDRDSLVYDTLYFNDGTYVIEYELPPWPPGFDTRFVDSRAIGVPTGCTECNSYGEGVKYNIHGTPAVDSFRLGIQRGDAGWPYFLQWPKGLGQYYDSIQLFGTNANVNMATRDTFTWMTTAQPLQGFLRIRYWGPKIPPAPPVAPSLLSPADNATNQPLNVIISWQPVSTATLYRVQVSTDSTFRIINVLNDTALGTSKSLTNLRGDRTFYWRVQASNAILETSPWSNRKFKTLLPAPVAPMLLSPVNNDSGVSRTPTLRWRHVDYASTYNIQLSKEPNFSIMVKDTSVSDTMYAVGLLDNCVVYYWRVRAVNATGNSPFSEARSFKIELVLPGSPSLISPADNASGIDSRPQLSWSSDKCSYLYRLEVAKDENFNMMVKDTITAQTSYKFHEVLERLTRYYWRVRGINQLGSGESARRSFVTTDIYPPAVPTLVAPLNNAIGVSLSPTLFWSAVYQGEQYRLQTAKDSEFNILVYNSLVSDTSKQIGPLESGLTYYWRVKAINAAGESNYSSTWQFTTLFVAPDPPLLDVPENGSRNVDVRPILRWYNAPRAVRYHLQVAYDSLFRYIFFSDSTLEVTNWRLSTLADFTDYYWRVRGWNSAGWGEFSTTYKFKTKWTVPVNWTVPLAIRESGPAGDTIYFGIHPNATAGIDPELNEFMLPPPDFKFFDARFIGPPNNPGILGTGLRVNYLKFRSYSQTDTFRFTFQPSIAGSYPIIISWQKSYVKNICDSMLLMDMSGFLIRKRMDMDSSQIVTDPNISSLLIILWGPIPTSVESPIREEIPEGFVLYHNYPNPFNPTTRIEFSTERKAEITIKIFDVMGKEITTLVNGVYHQGKYAVVWNGINNEGNTMPSGVYFVQMNAIPLPAVNENMEVYRQTHRMILLK